MAAPTIETRYKPEDLLTLNDDRRYELVDGQLVEKPAGAKSSFIAEKLRFRIHQHAEIRQAGLVSGSDCGYQIFTDDPDRVRYPDGSFIRRGRLPDNEPPNGHMRIAPDLALEVVSPNDIAEEIQQKVREYLQAGVQLVWVIYPAPREVLVYRQDGKVARLAGSDELSGEDVLPGFSCRVEDVFVFV